MLVSLGICELTKPRLAFLSLSNCLFNNTSPPLSFDLSLSTTFFPNMYVSNVMFIDILLFVYLSDSLAANLHDHIPGFVFLL